MRYPLVIFDWDGTLMDSVERIVSSMRVCAQQQQLRVPSEQEVRDIIGLSLEPGIERLFGRLAKRDLEQFLAAYKQHYVVTDPTPTPMFPGAIELLERLRQSGHQLAIATGKARPGLDRVLTEHQLHDYFISSRCARETDSKPAPTMLYEILAETGFDAHQAVMIGDSEHDLKMAEAAGVAAIGVSFGVHDKARLSAFNPLAIIDQLAELSDYL